MSLFVCQKCGCVENTALSHFWFRKDGPGLCSECDPAIGKWHGVFPKRLYTGAEQVRWIDGAWQETPKRFP